MLDQPKARVGGGGQRQMNMIVVMWIDTYECLQDRVLRIPSLMIGCVNNASRLRVTNNKLSSEYMTLSHE